MSRRGASEGSAAAIAVGGLTCIGAGFGGALGAIFGANIFDAAFVAMIGSVAGLLADAILLAGKRSN